MTTVYKLTRSGHANLKERLHIKAFKNANDAGAFLCKQTDNTWREVTPEHGLHNFPMKTGVYAKAGDAWHNVKSLDACVLAHI